ncbi:MAG: TAG lipase/steryl ester hydrolase/phospholipase A2/LPA acyltransferase [Halieaceae bacterium]|jgi:TAG lipase/steryl ester hydrolase/phospholipase A2/LPA acyltransferase
MLIVTQQQLKRALKKAASYQEWLEAAEAFDKHRGLDRWRQRDYSRQYDYVSLRTRVDRLRSLKARHDNRGLLYTLNEGIHGNMGGMGSTGLYAHALSGTKHLIEAYIEEIVHTLEHLASEDSGDISVDEKRDFFQRASHCFGHSAFMMSGSGSLLFFHVGVVRALVEAELLPTVMSGASGGAIVGSVVCTHTDEELREVLQPGYFLDRVPDPVGQTARADVGELEESIAQFVPDLTFEQAFRKTGRAINISIAPAETHQTSRLLNATTSPSVLVRSAVMASAAVPGIFPPVTLQALDSHGEQKSYLPSRRWVDGSVSDDMPAKRLARLYGVNHYIVSQTNPHVLPFVTDGLRKQTSIGILENAGRRASREWFNAITMIIDRADKKNGRITQATSLMRSVINQDYVGDINILPDYRLINPLKLFGFPGEKQMQKLIASGERCTWPKLEMIRQQTKISRALRKILQSYQDKLLI